MLIGISGNIGSGKTTASNYIVNKYSFQEYNFADPIKKIASIFGFTRNQLYGTQQQKLEIHEQWGISAREFLQKVGTDLFRNKLHTVIPNMKIDKSIWCDILKQKIDKSSRTLISDIRFIDEASTIRELGGYIIRIERPNIEIDNHISESQIVDIVPNITIINNGSLQDLYYQLDNILKSLDS
jgi:hypothetical protein